MRQNKKKDLISKSRAKLIKQHGATPYSNKRFLRVRDSSDAMRRGFIQLGITGLVKTDEDGVLQGTVKIFLDDGSKVPRLSAFLRKGYAFKNSAWEPRKRKMPPNL